MAVATVLVAAMVVVASGADSEMQVGPDGSITRMMRRTASPHVAAPAHVVPIGANGGVGDSVDESGNAEESLLQEGSAGGAGSAVTFSSEGAVFATLKGASEANMSGKLLAGEHMVQYMGELVLPVSTDCKIDLVKACQVLDVDKNGKISFDELKRSLHYFDPRSDWNWKTAFEEAAGQTGSDLSCSNFSSLVQTFLTKPTPNVCDKALVDRGCGVLNLQSKEHYGSPADDDPTVVHAKEIGELLSTPADHVVKALKSLNLTNQETDATALAQGAYAVTCMELCTKAYASLKQTTRDALKASNRACAADNGKLACDIDVSREQMYMEEQCSQKDLPAGFEVPVTPQSGLLESERVADGPRAFQGYNAGDLLKSVLNMFNVYPPTSAVESSLGNLLTLNISDGALLAYGEQWGHGSTIALLGGHSQKWCADEGDRIKCNRNEVGTWERFYLHDAGGGKWALRGGKNHKWCADEDSRIICNRNQIGSWEKFTIGRISGQNTARSFRGGKPNGYSNAKFCADEKDYGMKCNRHSVGRLERFDILQVHGSTAKHYNIYRRMATAQAWVMKAIQAMGGSGGARHPGPRGGAGNYVTSWFGNNNVGTRTLVLGRMNNVNGDMMNIAPEFPSSCRKDVLAYVHKGARNSLGQLIVHFCDHFHKFDANAQTRTVIHEVVHHPPSLTFDVVYGWDKCRHLARIDPSAAQRNAANYEMFTQDISVGRAGAGQGWWEQDGGGCFPRDATVQLKGGDTRELHELKVGDLVAVSEPGSGEVRYEPLLGDFHSDLEHQRQIEYVTVTHELGTVTASAAHYVHTLERGFSPAGGLRVGDTLSFWRGKSGGVQRSRVVALARQTKLGMYAPFTFGGTLLVDGVLASAYTADEFHSFLSPRAQEGVLALLGGHDGVHRLMHSLALPLRAWHYMGLPGLAKWGANLRVPGASAVGRIFSPAAAESSGTDDMPLYVNWVGRAVGSVLEMVV